MRAITSIGLFLVWAALGVEARPVPLMDPEEEDAVEVEVAGPPRIESEPGSVVSVGFAVYNHSEATRTLWPHWDVPEDWVVVSPPSSFTVPPQTRVVRLLSVRVPEAEQPGGYLIRFSAHSEKGEEVDGAELLVVVRTRYGLELSVLEAPRLASSTTPHMVRFLLSNTGNGDATAHLAVVSRPFEAWVGEAVVTITANSDREVAVRVEPPGDLQHRTRNRVRLEARLREDTTVTASAEAAVDVLPDAGRRQALRPPVTALARMSSIGGLVDQGVQAEVEGRLPLSGDSLHAVDVFLRTPSGAQTGFLQSDRYTVRYAGPQHTVSLGDGVYALSPLTTPGRYGVGAGGTAETEHFGARAYYRASRRSLVPDAEVGGALSLKAGPWGTYTLSGLHGTGLTRGAAVALRSEAVLGEALALDVEAGASGQERITPIYRLFLRGHVGPTGYYARTLRRGAEHPGQLTGYTHRTLGLTTALSNGFTVGMVWYDEETAARSFAEAVRQRRYFSTTATGQRRMDAWVVTGLVEVRHERLRQSASPLPLDRAQLQTRLRGSLGYRQLRVTARVAGARITDRAGGPRGTHRLVELETGWRRGSHRVEARLEWEDGASLQSAAPFSRWAVRVGGEEHLDERLSVRLDVSGGLLQLPDPVRVGAGWLRVGYRLPGGNRLLSEAQVTIQHGAYTSATANYRLTLEVALQGGNPLPLRGSLVEGIVIDQASGRGLPGVLVMFGEESTLTDTDGRFAFRRPAEGVYYLYLDRVTLGLDRVPTVAMPFMVMVPAQGAVELIRIPTTQHARLKGRVRVLEIRGGSSGVPADTVDVGAPRYAVVEAALGDLRHREICGADGRFDFRDLPPGDWTVRVVSSSEEHHTAPPVRVTVGGISEADVALRLLPPPRAIRVLEGRRLGALTPSSAAPESGRSTTSVSSDSPRLEPEASEQRGQLGRQILRVRTPRPQPQPPENRGSVPSPVPDDDAGAERERDGRGDEPLPEPRRE